jgi:hypothetical protein
MSGFDLELRRKLIGFNAHLKVVTPGRPLGEWDRVMTEVEKQPGVKGVAPFIIGQVMMQTEPSPERRGPQSFAPLVRGIDVELEGRVSVLTNRVIEGDFNLRGAGVLVGSTLADQLGISVGDRVALHSTSAMERMLKSRKGKQPELVPAEDYEVRGIFQVGYDQIDASFIAVLVTDDTIDAVHSLVYNLEPMLPLAFDELTADQDLGPPYLYGVGLNDFAGDYPVYAPPEPPLGERHKYTYTVYAYSGPALADGLSLSAFRTAVAGKVLATRSAVVQCELPRAR